MQLTRTLQVLALFVLTALILYFAAPVLVPLTFGLVFAMLLTPVCKWLERKGLNRGLATTGSLLFLLTIVAALVLLLNWQVGDLVKDMSKIEQQLQKLIDQVTGYIYQKFDVSPQQQKQMLKDQQSDGAGKIAGIIMAALNSVAGLMVNTLLVLVYTFVIIYFRDRFKSFVLRLTTADKQADAKKIMRKSSMVTQQYISGLGLMIVMLWVMYGIGFSIVGIKGAIFFAILCGTLEIVPFAGNITGTTITVLIALAQGGSVNMAIGVLITYGIVQFVQTYLLEPLVVGKQVSLNPLFTILIIVVGEALWGIAGMVLAIPLLGMFKVLCDNVEPLKPYGYLIGSQENASDDKSIFSKIFSSSDD